MAEFDDEAGPVLALKSTSTKRTSVQVRRRNGGGGIWTSRRGCTVSGGMVGGGFWDAYRNTSDPASYPFSCR